MKDKIKDPEAILRDKEELLQTAQTPMLQQDAPASSRLSNGEKIPRMNGGFEELEKSLIAKIFGLEAHFREKFTQLILTRSQPYKHPRVFQGDKGDTGTDKDETIRKLRAELEEKEAALARRETSSMLVLGELITWVRGELEEQTSRTRKFRQELEELRSRVKEKDQDPS